MATYTISTNSNTPFCGYENCKTPARYVLRDDDEDYCPHYRCNEHLVHFVQRNSESMISLTPNLKITYQVNSHPGNREVASGILEHKTAEKLVQELSSGDQSVNTAGPMWCEKHDKTLWPHGNCAGPGMWINNAELEFFGISALHEHPPLQFDQ